MQGVAALSAIQDVIAVPTQIVVVRAAPQVDIRVIGSRCSREVHIELCQHGQRRASRPYVLPQPRDSVESNHLQRRLRITVEFDQVNQPIAGIARLGLVQGCSQLARSKMQACLVNRQLDLVEIRFEPCLHDERTIDTLAQPFVAGIEKVNLTFGNTGCEPPGSIRGTTSAATAATSNNR